MEQTTKDCALMQALAPKEPRQLPSNFPYLTMRRIQEEQRLEERRQKRFAILSVIIVSLVGIAALLYFIGLCFITGLFGMTSHSVNTL